MNVKEQQEKLIEQLADALNKYDGINADINYVAEEGKGTIIFYVENMEHLRQFCTDVKDALSAVFVISYLYYDDTETDKLGFALETKCRNSKVFEESVNNLINAIKKVTEK